MGPDSVWTIARQKGRRTRTLIYLGIIASVVLVTWCMLPGGTSFATSTRLQARAVAVPKYFFGLLMHRPSDATWPTVPFSGMRLWDTYLTWSDLETRKGGWNFTRLDTYLELAAKHQADVLLTLGTPPPWASARPKEPPAFRPGGAAEPRDIEDWRNYIRSVVTHCRGRVYAYEIWNEPNLKQFYTGSVEQMVTLAREAYVTVKQADPDARVVSPSPTGDGGVTWLAEFLSRGGGQYADAIGYHFYVTPRAPEAMIPLILKVRETMAQYGVSAKPLWCTEAGWFIQNREGTVQSQGAYVPLTSNQAAGYVARTYLLSWAAGVSRFYWYDWDSTTMALADDNGKSPKPAAIAYREVEKWLVGAQMSSCSSDNQNTWACDLLRGSNSTSWIVWNPDRTFIFQLPGTWRVRHIRDLSGQGREVPSSKKIEIGPSPLLLEP